MKNKNPRKGLEKMKERLNIVYDGKVNRKMDDELEKVLKKYHYKFVGSGYNFRAKKRDITYEIRL